MKSWTVEQMCFSAVVQMQLFQSLNATQREDRPFHKHSAQVPVTVNWFQNANASENVVGTTPRIL